jgi:hypothetical protein
VIKPLYLYDHSGSAIRTHSFQDHWDSGQVGWVYLTKAQVKEECGSGPDALEQTDQRIESEVEEYDLHISGQVYGYDISCDGESWDSCWGIFGLDWARKEATDAARTADD